MASDSPAVSLGDDYECNSTEIEVQHGRFGKTHHGRNKKTGEEIIVKKLGHCDPENEGNKISEIWDQYTKNKQLKQHNNIVRYWDHHFRKKDGTHWLVMENCDKGNLLDYIQKVKCLNAKLKITIMNQCSKGIKDLHDQNIVHRFIHPKNILVKTEGERDVVKIGDFMMSSIFECERSASKHDRGSASSAVPNTYEDYFKAPEYFITGKYPEKTSYDVFCLGLVFQSLLHYNDQSLHLCTFLAGMYIVLLPFILSKLSLGLLHVW